MWQPALWEFGCLYVKRMLTGFPVFGTSIMSINNRKISQLIPPNLLLPLHDLQLSIDLFDGYDETEAISKRKKFSLIDMTGGWRTWKHYKQN